MDVGTVRTVEYAYRSACTLSMSGADFEQLGPALRDARKAIDDLTRAAVADATRRHSWTTIGRALGISRQAARQRFSRC